MESLHQLDLSGVVNVVSHYTEQQIQDPVVSLRVATVEVVRLEGPGNRDKILVLSAQQSAIFFPGALVRLAGDPRPIRGGSRK